MRIVPRVEWPDDNAIGICSFEKCEIKILKGPRLQMEHTFLHEAMHAILEAVNSPLYEKESFVDPVSGLLHQVLTTGD